MSYEVWFTERKTGVRKLLSTHEKKEDADFSCYLDWSDEPSPDKDEYFSWTVEKVDDIRMDGEDMMPIRDGATP